MSEDKSSEIAKMALECLKTKLQTELANAEAQGKTSDLFKTIVDELGKVLPLLINELYMKKRLVKKKDFLALTKEDLMFFAKKAALLDLEVVVCDLKEVLESRKKAESK